jgi:hypothetical protein
MLKLAQLLRKLGVFLTWARRKRAAADCGSCCRTAKTRLRRASQPFAPRKQPPDSEEPPTCLARGDTVISTENDSNDSKITVWFPKECQPMPVNGSVE